MQEVRERIRQIFLPIIEAQQIDFVDLDVRGLAGNLSIRVFVDVPGGITIEKCSSLSLDLRGALEMTDAVDSRNCRLEVSSPGLDRPLRSERDFFRNIGRLVEITTTDEALNEANISGEIAGAEDGEIAVRVAKENIVSIPVARIKNALLQINWS